MNNNLITKKGIILAGGRGTRLYPITKAIPKSLVPLYNKPTIFYSLSVLLKQKCNDILIICCPEYLNLFKNLLGNGDDLNIKIQYEIQTEARGIADAFIVGEKFLNGHSVTLILGDNIFIGDLPILENNNGAHIIEVPVKDAFKYGVYDKKNNKFIEKPEQNLNFNFAIPGIYWFDKNVCKYTKLLKPSNRNELEITDLCNIYLKNENLKITRIEDVKWFDTGNFEDLADASNYIRFIENKFGEIVGDPYHLKK